MIPLIDAAMIGVAGRAPGRSDVSSQPTSLSLKGATQTISH